jgi:putative transposase
MRGTRHTEEQIIAILKQAEGGLKTAEVCRQHEITDATLYRWKAKYGGMEVSDAKKLRQLEEENRKLKHVVAELTLDNRALKDCPKTGEACGPKEGGATSDGSIADERASCLQADRIDSGNAESGHAGVCSPARLDDFLAGPRGELRGRPYRSPGETDRGGTPTGDRRRAGLGDWIAGRSVTDLLARIRVRFDLHIMARIALRNRTTSGFSTARSRC